MLASPTHTLGWALAASQRVRGRAALRKRVKYVGQRVKWFFEQQKEPIVQFMKSLRGATPNAGPMRTHLDGQ
eukprot:280847-Alexandrium_andersonii.AAC.1